MVRLAGSPPPTMADMGGSLASAPWLQRPCRHGDEEISFYIKMSTGENGGEGTIKLLVTDLARVWLYEGTRNEAMTQLKEDNPSFASDEKNLVKGVTGAVEAVRDSGQLSCEFGSPPRGPLNLLAKLNIHATFIFRCTQLPAVEASEVLRAQLVRPLLQIAELLRFQANLPDSGEEQSCREAVHKLLVSGGYEGGIQFDKGCIRYMYTALVTRASPQHPGPLPVADARAVEGTEAPTTPAQPTPTTAEQEPACVAASDGGCGGPASKRLSQPRPQKGRKKKKGAFG